MTWTFSTDYVDAKMCKPIKELQALVLLFMSKISITMSVTNVPHCSGNFTNLYPFIKAIQTEVFDVGIHFLLFQINLVTYKEGIHAVKVRFDDLF